jgi:hypothetical protein
MPNAAARAAARLLALAALALTPLPAAHATGAHAARAACTTGAAATRSDPFGTDECPGVRPGALLTSGSEQCTFGFVFQGSDRRRYVATAGHCAFATDPDRTIGATQTWKPGTGPAVTDAGGRQVGRFAFATQSGQFKDFALVRLDPGVAANPQMCHFGGPTRLTTEVHNDDVQVHHYGHGVGLGDTVPARTGDAFFGLYRPDYVYFYGAAVEGDSGSPVIDATGAAVGIITDRSTPFTGNVGVNRLADHLAAAQKALKIRLTLATAPLL